jgi:NhaP-type Na+/H+ or K+/H+ antiporter/mannitol/fructose-specific phosphotransferase system IIA component (Ntr-type)
MEQLVQHAALNSLAVAVAGGFFLTLLARKIQFAAIVLLLIAGVALGPEGLGLVQPQSLESVLPAIVSLAVGIILFEGGLTLDLRGYRAGSTVITRLLSIGVVVTWLGAAVSIHFLFGTDLGFSLLTGSLVIVTGPTVIGPLLKRIKIQSRLHSILHWEGVLIDPIGVFVGVICFEWLVDRSGAAVVEHLTLRLLSGIALGALGGYAIVVAFRRKWIPENLQNTFALASAVLIFGVTEAVISEAGLISVTLAGFIVGWLQPLELRQIRLFKAEITDLLIGMLFILLAARLEFSQFRDFGARGLVLVALIIFVVRPVNVLVCTWRSPLTWRERLFLSWIAPRGIVAASMASLFAIALAALPFGGDPDFLVTFTFSVILATVVLQGSSAAWAARLLGLRRPEPTGWLIVNGDAFGRRLAQFIRDQTGLDVLILDTNARMVAEAREEKLPALCEDALNIDLGEEREEFQSMGRLLALTDNSDLNELLCHRWSASMGREDVYRWQSLKATNLGRSESHGQVIFPEMLRPSIVAAELVDGLATLTTVTYENPPQEIDGLPLLVARGGAVLPILDSEKQNAFVAGDRLFILERSGRFLARGLEAGRVVDVEGAELPAIYEQLIEVLVVAAPAISRVETLRAFTDPTAATPAIIAHGAAVANCYSPQVRRRICVVGRLRQPLEIAGQKEPIALVFLLVSPAGDPEGHLATLGEIERFCRDRSKREALLTFTKPEDARRYLRRRAG